MRQTAAHIQSLTLALAALLAVAGCSKPKSAEEQTRGELVVPEFQGSVRPAFLTDGSGTSEYTGSFIVWDSSVSRASMAEVVKASRHYNELLVEQLKYLRSEIKPLDREISSLQIKLKAREGERNIALLSGRLGNAGQWFEDRLAAPSLAGLDDTDKVQARAIFDAICEGAIWQKALALQFVKSSYKSIPTPNALCKSVYERKGLLSPSVSACAPSDSEHGKNYFACFWQEGVVKTALFQRYGQRVQEIAALDPTAILAAIVDSGVGLKILRQMPNVTIGGQVVSFKFNGQVMPTDNTATLATANVDMILTHFTKPLANPHADALGIVSSKRVDRDPAVIPAADKLRDDFRIFWEQLNEAKFNDPLLTETADNGVTGTHPDLSNIDLTPYDSIFAATDATLDAKVGEVRAQIADRKSVRETKRVVGESLISGETCDQFPDNLPSCKIDKALNEQADAVAKPGVGLAMMSGTELVFHRPVGSNRLSFALTFNARNTDVKQMRGCINTDTGSKADLVECGFPDRLKQKEDLSESFVSGITYKLDAASGKFVIEFDADNVKDMGLELKERKTGQVDFNLIDGLGWQGHHVSFEIYPNSLSQVLLLYSGSGKIATEGANLNTSLSLTSAPDVP